MLGARKRECCSPKVKAAKTSATPQRSNNYDWPKKTDIGPNYKQPLKGISGGGMK